MCAQHWLQWVGGNCRAEPTSVKEGRALTSVGGEVFFSSLCKLIGMGAVFRIWLSAV